MSMISDETFWWFMFMIGIWLLVLTVWVSTKSSNFNTEVAFKVDNHEYTYWKEISIREAICYLINYLDVKLDDTKLVKRDDIKEEK